LNLLCTGSKHVRGNAMANQQWRTLVRSIANIMPLNN
jgi:hypothetical protein